MYCSLIGKQCLQIMASSLNGLSVGDSLPDNIMESPARSETASCFRSVIAHLVHINYKHFIYECLLMRTPSCIGISSSSRLEKYKMRINYTILSLTMFPINLSVVQQNCFSRNESSKNYG